jgi:pimeloyl-ACP methyl ester carboxylesterase
MPRSTQTNQARVDLRGEHVPLLFIAGDQVPLVPLKLVQKNVAAYDSSAGTLDVEQFDNRSHFTCNQPGWESVRDRALDWLGKA